MIALISEQGLVFGTVVALAPRRLRIEVAAELPGEPELEWRMELTGLPDTAMGWLRLRPGGSVTSGLATHEADILRVANEDRELFELWVDGVLNHHIVATRPRDAAGAFGAASTMQGTTPGERAAVVRRMEEQRKHRSKRAMEVLAAGKRRWPSPDDEAGGRRAVALAWSPSLKPASLERVVRPPPRLAVVRPTVEDEDPTTRPLPTAPPPLPSRPEDAPHLRFDGASAPRQPLPPHPSSSPAAAPPPGGPHVAPRPPPRAPLPPPPPPDPVTRPLPQREVVWEPNTRPTRPTPAAATPPLIEVDSIAGHCFVTVSWREGCDWLGQVVPVLEAGLLTVDTRALGAPGTAVRVVLRRPDGAETRATAEVRQVGEAGSTLRFRPPGVDRRWLLP